ncbi:Clp family protein [Streptomyces sp. NBRC 110611]|uniref:TerD family protein n=1 Tax=Streptomyces sp. NBRC 110611 TaxID=1621259 RepID=UPI0008313197|nr:TerD family protein [Streptomyces sp. NBRC 110611]GAU70786.1 Clp family protein [Streptomyces sp. NBRC 110611]
MSVALTKGGNVSLTKQAPGLTAVRVGLGWQIGATGGAGYDLDASALLCGETGKVLSDDHFVFFNNLASPDGSVRHSGNAPAGGSGGDDEQIRVDLTRVPAEVAKIVFPVSLYEAERRGQNFGQVRSAHIRVVDEANGTEIARYDLRGDAATETAMVFGELYRHGADWKFRAIGQGYASGLAGIAQDFGVDVLRSSPAPAVQAPSVPAPAPTPSAPPAPSVSGSTTGWETSAQGAPIATSQQPTGSSSMTCFFDPSHGPGMTPVTWSPQWGVPRQIQACGGCAQRVQTTPPPYYTAPQAGYPQPVQQGYQQGYPQPAQQGYPQEQHHGQQGGRRFGTGALIGAGAAGLVGGALINEALDDDEPEMVVNNFYEE